MSTGSVENFLLWTNEVHYIIKNKSYSTSKPKFDMVTFRLYRDGLNKWTTTKKNSCKQAICLYILK